MLLTKLNNTLKKYPFFTFILACFLIIFIVNISQFETIEGKRNRKRKMRRNIKENPIKNPIKKPLKNFRKNLRKKINRNYNLIKKMHPELQYNE